ncbi:hypothetical protein [Streptomyces sp. YIM S03343]
MAETVALTLDLLIGIHTETLTEVADHLGVTKPAVVPPTPADFRNLLAALSYATEDLPGANDHDVFYDTTVLMDDLLDPTADLTAAESAALLYLIDRALRPLDPTDYIC